MSTPPSSFPGAILGTPGGGMHDADWAASAEVAQIGCVGEEQTAAVLARLALEPGGPTVLHDLAVPVAGTRANIDHVLVAGKTVVLIDTKVWRPGFLWTWGSTTRRGWSRDPNADKKTMPWARSAITSMLRNQGAVAEVGVPLLVVWAPPSRPGMAPKRPPSLWAYRPSGARAVTGDRLEKVLRRMLKPLPVHSGDPAVVGVLSQLLPGATRSSRPRPTQRTAAASREVDLDWDTPTASNSPAADRTPSPDSAPAPAQRTAPVGDGPWDRAANPEQDIDLSGW